MTPAPYDPEDVNDAAIRAGMKSLDGKYPVTVRYEKFDRAPYDPSGGAATMGKVLVFVAAFLVLKLMGAPGWGAVVGGWVILINHKL